ncbi:MAG: molybdopterin-dependent oxidoreductase [Chloroflexi bacterium]|nr:molybdopterin-dependent oxidoreductase [Chloroflexota bacterium]
MVTVEQQLPSGEIGRPRPRVEDLRLITGHGRFVEDVALPGLLHLALVRSPYPHARITRIDTTAASVATGVRAVVTGADVPVLANLPATPVSPNLRVPPFELLCRTVVRAVGMPVAAVVATSRAAAADAAQLVEVDYEPLPAVAEAEAALAPDAPVLYPEFGSNVCYTLEAGHGDVEAAFAGAAHVTRLRVTFPRLAPVPLEPRGVVASYDPTSQELTIWATTQSPHRVRWLASLALGMPEPRIRVLAPDMGGGFGGRGAVYGEYLLAAWLARQLGAPVRWIATRSEDITTGTHGRDQIVYIEAAAEADGRLRGLRARIITNLGAFLQVNTPTPAPQLLRMLPGCYRVPAYRGQLTGVFTNTTPTAPYRGAGRPEAADTIERLMDQLARELQLDPIELRRRNFIRRDEFPYRTPAGVTYDSGDYAAALDRLLTLADYPALRARQAAERARGERTLLGIGLASFVEPSAGGWESGAVRVEPSGDVTVATGSSAHGQGHETSFAQIVADRLGVPFERVIVRRSDTAVTPPGVGTFGSRSTVLGGSALVQAADQVLEKARRIAAGLLEASPDDIRLEQGRFQVAGAPERHVTWAQVAAAAYGRGRLPPGETPGLEASAYFDPHSETYGFGAALAVVRIDPDTGQVRVEHLWAVDDCGTVINPLLVEGQIEGGTAQGFGQAVLEQVVYEPDGTLATGSLMHYALPRASTMPPLTIAEMVTPSPLNPLGTKGVGESGTIIGTAPIMNAVADALAPLGIAHLDMPYTPERVWAALQAARRTT